jgi:uncharacterized membrane protein YhiD involved in acid resistance
MLNDLQNLNLFTVSTSEIILNLCVALICGLCITWLYRATHKGPGYSSSFINSIVLLTMIASVMVMVIGNNLARAFGLVGAMSIIRFRTAVKETQDIVFIFFGLCVGMAAGIGYYKIAFTGTIFIGIILFVLSKISSVREKQNEYLLQVSFSVDADNDQSYISILNKYCRDHKEINIKYIEEQNAMEVSYYVKFKSGAKSNEFLRELKEIPGMQNINLFFDEEEI